MTVIVNGFLGLFLVARGLESDLSPTVGSSIIIRGMGGPLLVTRGYGVSTPTPTPTATTGFNFVDPDELTMITP
jgi:hypothetical protein